MNRQLTFVLLIMLIPIIISCSNVEINASEDRNGDMTHSITDFSNESISFNGVPERIVVLSNGDLDMITALGGKVVGRPNASLPDSLVELTDVEQIGSTHEIDLEKVTYVQPEIVIGHTQMNLGDRPTIESLGAKMVLSHAQSVTDIQEQLQLFGEMLQQEDKANQLINSIDEKVEEIAQLQKGADEIRVLLIYGAPGTYMAALPNSLSGHMLELVGAHNIASDFPSLEAFPQYAQLNSERIVEADPHYILLMSHGDSETVKEGFIKEMEQNAAWNQITAVQNNAVDVLPNDLFGSNPGTRITEALDLLVKMFYSNEEQS
ncbi:ABC transporter substrate-binding protein [Halalkalibacter hemicellulosilyticus]|uniref:Heme transporter IsdDEF n=1 Tax=Halalkalibacter hemicellulosilyticusJCM 9152 TaxID=1236971 RepID=W4QJE8_9BACI|nr:ABC transporter substrate-binding protein [Halalkalibacter hemicellulosilyticus]GAE32245.1 heme transporter IsdDEF [Halalkalibacter hemicellulosilyticusJCM 9152]